MKSLGGIKRDCLLGKNGDAIFRLKLISLRASAQINSIAVILASPFFLTAYPEGSSKATALEILPGN